MEVWLPQELSASRPTMPATLASESKIDASHRASSISAINDRLVPKDENDRSLPYYHWWPKQGTTEWITYEFPAAVAVYRKAGRYIIKMHKASGTPSQVPTNMAL